MELGCGHMKLCYIKQTFLNHIYKECFTPLKAIDEITNSPLLFRLKIYRSIEIIISGTCLTFCIVYCLSTRQIVPSGICLLQRQPILS